MYEGSASTRWTSVLGRAIANTSTWSPPTELAIEARSLSEAATRTLATAGDAAASAHSARMGSSRRITAILLELMGLVGPHREDDTQCHGVDVREGGESACRGPGHGVDEVDAERGGLLEQREARIRAHRLVGRVRERVTEAL